MNLRNRDQSVFESNEMILFINGINTLCLFVDAILESGSLVGTIVRT